MVQIDFEEAWRRYINDDTHNDVEQLRQCLKSAISFDQFCQVFTATMTSEWSALLCDVRGCALKKLISAAATKSEAEHAYALAHPKGRGGHRFPVRAAEAKEKLNRFMVAT